MRSLTILARVGAAVFVVATAATLAVLWLNLRTGATWHFWLFWLGVAQVFIASTVLCLRAIVSRTLFRGALVLLISGALAVTALLTFIAVHF